MSRLRKQVLASREANAGSAALSMSAPSFLPRAAGVLASKKGVASAAGLGVRGLATKELRRSTGGVSLAETRQMESETMDLERQLDTLRMQMHLEKERHGALINSQGGIWKSAQHPSKKRNKSRPARKLTSRDGGRRVPAADFSAAASFNGQMPGFTFKTGPNGTGYYRDTAAATVAAANQAPKPTSPSAARRTHTPASSAPGAQPLPGDLVPSPPVAASLRASRESGGVASDAADADTQRIGEQAFNLESTFATDGNFSSSLFPDDDETGGVSDPASQPSPQRDEPIKFFNEQQPQGGGGDDFDEAASHASFLEALNEWRGHDGPPPPLSAQGRSQGQGRGQGQRAYAAPTAVAISAPGASSAMAVAAAPIECQTQSSRPLAVSRPMSARPSSAAERRRSYFASLVNSSPAAAAEAAAAAAARGGGGDGAAARRAELLRLRESAARQQDELRALRARNLALKQEGAEAERADAAELEQALEAARAGRTQTPRGGGNPSGGRRSQTPRSRSGAGAGMGSRRPGSAAAAGDRALAKQAAAKQRAARQPQPQPQPQPQQQAPPPVLSPGLGATAQLPQQDWGGIPMTQSPRSPGGGGGGGGGGAAQISPPRVGPEAAGAAVTAGFAVGMAARAEAAARNGGVLDPGVEARAAELARKEVARQFTDLLLRPCSAPAGGRRRDTSLKTGRLR